jgi:hypothetical protein
VREDVLGPAGDGQRTRHGRNDTGMPDYAIVNLLDGLALA